MFVYLFVMFRLACVIRDLMRVSLFSVFSKMVICSNTDVCSFVLDFVCLVFVLCALSCVCVVVVFVFGCVI